VGGVALCASPAAYHQHPKCRRDRKGSFVSTSACRMRLTLPGMALPRALRPWAFATAVRLFSLPRVRRPFCLHRRRISLIAAFSDLRWSGNAFRA